MIDLRQWDQRQTTDRVLPDGSIRVDLGELEDLKLRLWLDSKEKGNDRTDEL